MLEIKQEVKGWQRELLMCSKSSMKGQVSRTRLPEPHIKSPVLGRKVRAETKQSLQCYKKLWAIVL